MPADPKAQIERINQVSAMARTSWIALLGYLAFVGVTLLGVEDADFFVPSRQTQLPLVNVSIPTASFFVFAPILAAALYVYLHIILLKLWDAIADLTDPTFEDQPIGDALVPWLANDWALSVRGGPFLPARPLRALGNLASFLLVWAAAPLALFFFWWWSMPAHRPWLSLLLAACFLIALATGITAWRTAHAWLSGRRPPPVGHPPLWTALREVLKTRRPSRLRVLAAALGDAVRRNAGIWALGLALAYVTLLRTAWPTADEPPLARADVSGVEMVALPDGWRDWEAARTAFRETWCRREGLDTSVCGPPPDPDPGAALPKQTLHERGEWCGEHGFEEGASCDQAFGGLNARFDTYWREERRSAIDDLPGLDLEGRDLRSLEGQAVTLVGANLREARLEGANLSFARLEGANLSFARLAGAFLSEARLEEASLILSRLEGANLVGARLEGANLGGARLTGAYLGATRLEGAFLSDARLEGAFLKLARLEGAFLGGARLTGANLSEAGLEGANLSEARLDGADLREARLEGANLSEARLEGADLSEADLRKSKWAGTSNPTLLAHFADLRGAQGLTQAQLDTMIGNAGTLLTFVPDNVQPLYVWSCWETPPQGFDALVARVAGREGSDPEDVRAEFLCGPDNPHVKTGTPLALDAPYPPGHPLATR